jgi:hypothetical protein
MLAEILDLAAATISKAPVGQITLLFFFNGSWIF